MDRSQERKARMRLDVAKSLNMGRREQSGIELPIGGSNRGARYPAYSGGLLPAPRHALQGQNKERLAMPRKGPPTISKAAFYL